MSGDVIVLNGDWSFLGFISWKRAFTLAFKNKAEILKDSSRMVVTCEGTFKVPSIIRLIKTIRVLYKKEIPFSKKNVFVRDNYTCQYCGKKLTQSKVNDLYIKPTLDHVIPQARGGKSTWENCVCACMDCNSRKSDKTLSEAGLYLKVKPWKPTISEFLRIKMQNINVQERLNDLWNGE